MSPQPIMILRTSSASKRQIDYQNINHTITRYDYSQAFNRLTNQYIHNQPRNSKLYENILRRTSRRDSFDPPSLRQEHQYFFKRKRMEPYDYASTTEDLTTAPSKTVTLYHKSTNS